MSITEMTIADLDQTFRSAAGDAEGEAFAAGNADTTFVDLGYDSLALLQVIGQLRREKGVQAPEEQLAAAKTPAQLLAIMKGEGQ